MFVRLFILMKDFSFKFYIVLARSTGMACFWPHGTFLKKSTRLNGISFSLKNYTAEINSKQRVPSEWYPQSIVLYLIFSINTSLSDILNQSLCVYHLQNYKIILSIRNGNNICRGGNISSNPNIYFAEPGIPAGRLCPYPATDVSFHDINISCSKNTKWSLVCESFCP